MSLHSDIIERILKQLEAGTAPWVKPWAVPLPYNAATQYRYSGINVLLLWNTPYERPAWITYRQAEALGGHVKKGEHGFQVVFVSKLKKHEGDEEKSIPFLRRYFVFNVEQVEGLPKNVYAPPVSTPGCAEEFLEAIPAEIHHGGTEAFYRRSTDVIHLPHPEHFASQSDYYATRLHETVHWSGHPRRLNRDFGKRYGDEAYALEELVAELGSAFLSAELGLPPELHHAEYLGNWITALRDHRQAIFTAAAKASAAAAYLSLKCRVGQSAEMDAANSPLTAQTAT